MMGDLLIRWTIRAGLVAFVARLVVGLLPGSAAPHSERVQRWLWTVACGLLWIHVACAFQFEHHWSHEAAYLQTARETAAVTGLDWGGGLWINYALMLLWAADVAWWWISPASFPSRPALVNWLWLGFLIFITFNATVIFKTGPLRWCGVVVTTVLFGLWWRQSNRSTGQQTVRVEG
jgi:hypothetical protein